MFICVLFFFNTPLQLREYLKFVYSDEQQLSCHYTTPTTEGALREGTGCGTNHKPLPCCICQCKIDQINSINSNQHFPEKFSFFECETGCGGDRSWFCCRNKAVEQWSCYLMGFVDFMIPLVCCLLFWLMLWPLSYNHLSHHRVTAPKCSLVVLGPMKSWALCLILPFKMQMEHQHINGNICLILWFF